MTLLSFYGDLVKLLFLYMKENLDNKDNFFGERPIHYEIFFLLLQQAKNYIIYFR